jgi:hypothetical protein
MGSTGMPSSWFISTIEIVAGRFFRGEAFIDAGQAGYR